MMKFNLQQTIAAIREFQARSRAERFASLVNAVNIGNRLNTVQVTQVANVADSLWGRFAPRMNGTAGVAGPVPVVTGGGTTATIQCIRAPCP